MNAEAQTLLAQAADKTGEALALSEDAIVTGDHDRVLGALQELNLLIWKLRWACGPISYQIAVKGATP